MKHQAATDKSPKSTKGDAAKTASAKNSKTEGPEVQKEANARSRGDAPTADKPSERSPKTENL